jgi:FeS assembly SUF system regulator
MTKQADYGIVLMTRMADEPERLFAAQELASATGIPSPTVSKILKQLTREDLLSSQRGAKGGYTLAQPPHEITVAAMVTALDGPIAFTECVEDTPGVCSQEAVCRLRSNWQRINLALKNTLEGISLAELARPLQPLVQLTAGAANAEQRL